MQALGREILGRDMKLQGNVRVTAPEGITGLILPEAIAESLQCHPQMSIDLVGTASALDLSRREAEIAIRATRQPPDTSLGRKVCDFRFAAYGSAKYVAEHRDTPLSEQRWCTLAGAIQWLVPRVCKQQREAERQLVLTCGSFVPLLSAVAAGVGVTLMPCYLCDPDPRLVRLGAPFEWLTIELWVLTHPDLRHTARVKALMTHLHDHLAARREMFEGKRQSRGHRRGASRK